MARLKIIDSISYRDLIIMAQSAIKLHLTLPRAIDSEHCQTTSEHIIPILMQFFFDGIQTRQKDDDRGFGMMPRFPENAVHVEPMLIWDSNAFAREVEVGESALIGSDDVLVGDP
jgi:hypothetical protein